MNNIATYDTSRHYTDEMSADEWINNAEHFAEMEYADFKYDIEGEFKQHIGKEIIITTKNRGWDNQKGECKFILDDTDEIFEKIWLDTDLRFQLWKQGARTYTAKMYHHDSPTGEDYKIKVKERKAK